MKICVVGAGAIGGLMGVKLALAGEDVTLFARRAHLEAIRKNGLKVIMNDGEELVARDIKATDDMSDAGPQDQLASDQAQDHTQEGEERQPGPSPMATDQGSDSRS